MGLIKVGISRCLLGHNVRYNGESKLDELVTGELAEVFDWYPVCPEVEAGFPIPRPATKLVGAPEAPRFVTIENGEDNTEKLAAWIEKKISSLRSEGLCGFVFKARSPSCAFDDTELHSGSGISKSPGLFALAFMQAFPGVPVIDEVRLRDKEAFASFLSRARELNEKLNG